METNRRKKKYVDIDSIEKYTDSYTKNQSTYSFWLKELNDKKPYFVNFEKRYNKKIWYQLTRYLINCKDKTISLKAYTIYDLNGNTIDSYEIPAYSITYSSIVPDSVGEMYYYGICSP